MTKKDKENFRRLLDMYLVQVSEKLLLMKQLEEIHTSKKIPEDWVYDFQTGIAVFSVGLQTDLFLNATLRFENALSLGATALEKALEELDRRVPSPEREEPFPDDGVA